MKKLYVVLFLSLSFLVKAQNQIDSLAGFDMEHFNEHVSEIKDAKAKSDYLNKVHRSYIKRKYGIGETSVTHYKVDSTAGCGNLDFENGSLSGWALTGDFQLTVGNATDPYGCFPVVCPGGNYSLRLNDDNTSVSKVNFASSASKTIAITSANSTIKINFAACFLKYPHPSSATANLKVEFFDQVNNIISTQTISVYYSTPPGAITAPSGITSFNSIVTGTNILSQNFSVSCLPWQDQTFNLSTFIGQNVKLKLSADWCLYNADWAYAYFDVCCSASCPNPTPFMCSGSTCSSFPNTLCSPPNMMNYSWVGPGGPIATNTCITTSTAGTYSLTCYSVSNPTLPLNYTYTIIPSPSLTFTMPGAFCNVSSSGTTLFASPSGGTFSGPGVTGNNFNPQTAGIGTHTISYNYTNPSTGCSATATQTTVVTSCTGIKEQAETKDIIIAPNPFSNYISVLGLRKDVLKHSEIVLYNVIGKEVLREKMNENTNTVDAGQLPPGIYIYSISNENQLIKKEKLIKE